MKIFAFGIRDDEKPALEEWKAANPNVEVAFTEYDLTADSAFLADDANGVVAMQLSHYPKDAFKVLNGLGIHYLSLRNTNVDNLNFSDLKEFGISLTNVPDYSSASIAEHVIVLMGQLLQKQPQFAKKMQAGNFTWSPTIGNDFGSQTVGVIGTGHTGQAVIKLLKAFGCRIIAYDRQPNADLLQEGLYVDVDSLTELFQQSDVITLQVPLTTDTKYLVNERSLAQMKAGAYLINCAHGQLVNTKALITALDSGHLAGAGLDVLDDESSVFGKTWSSLENIPNREIRNLFHRDNVIITPHNSFYTKTAVHNMVITAFNSNKDLIMGKRPSTIVNLN